MFETVADAESAGCTARSRRSASIVLAGAPRRARCGRGMLGAIWDVRRPKFAGPFDSAHGVCAFASRSVGTYTDHDAVADVVTQRGASCIGRFRGRCAPGLSKRGVRFLAHLPTHCAAFRADQSTINGESAADSSEEYLPECLQKYGTAGAFPSGGNVPRHVLEIGVVRTA